MRRVWPSGAQARPYPLRSQSRSEVVVKAGAEAGFLVSGQVKERGGGVLSSLPAIMEDDLHS